MIRTLLVLLLMLMVLYSPAKAGEYETINVSNAMNNALVIESIDCLSN